MYTTVDLAITSANGFVHEQGHGVRGERSTKPVLRSWSRSQTVSLTRRSETTMIVVDRCTVERLFQSNYSSSLWIPRTPSGPADTARTRLYGAAASSAWGGADPLYIPMRGPACPPDIAYLIKKLTGALLPE